MVLSCRVALGLIWLLASLATAALSHAAIDAAGQLWHGEADAYGEHAHGAVAPVLLAAAGLAAGI